MILFLPGRMASGSSVLPDGLWKKYEKGAVHRKFPLRTAPFLAVPAAGLEPARGCPRQILSLMRLPFRHAGIGSKPNISLS